jgi:hypothetical protein
LYTGGETKITIYVASITIALVLSLILIFSGEDPNTIPSSEIAVSAPEDLGGMWFWLIWPIFTILEFV